MLTVDRRKGQSLLLVHRKEQCIIRVADISYRGVKLQFVGDRFRFLRTEKAEVNRCSPGLRHQHHDGTIVQWN